MEMEKGTLQEKYNYFPPPAWGSEYMRRTQPQTPLHGLACSAFQPSHYFQLNQLPCKHMGDRWVLLFSCRSGVLNNIQKDRATLHLALAKMGSSSLPPKCFFLLVCSKSMQTKKGILTMHCKKVWRTLTKLKQNNDFLSEGPKWKYCTCIGLYVQHKARVVMWRPEINVLTNPNALILCLNFLKLNKQCVIGSSGYHPSATVCERVFEYEQCLCLPFDL